jgi:hypothetical protein
MAILCENGDTGCRAVGLAGFPPDRDRKPARALDLRAFGEIEGVFHISAEVADGALDLRAAKQNLNGT